jgi:hypothetical protein
MDDLWNLAKDPVKQLELIGKRFKLGKIQLLDANTPAVYTGLDILWDDKNWRCEMDQLRYVQAIKTSLTDKEKKKAFSEADLNLTDESQIALTYGPAQQSWNGILGWLNKTQPHMSVIFGEISRNSTRPCETSVKAAMRACEYAKLTHQNLVYGGVKDPVLVWWVDASYHIKTCEGRLGWEVQLVDSSELAGKEIYEITKHNLLAWRSRRCERKLASTTSAELMALQEGVKLAPAYSNYIKELWMKAPRVIFITDNQPLLGWLRTGWIQTDPALQGVLDFVRSRIHDMKAEVLWVPTKHQRADRHTKLIVVKQ